MYAIGILVVVVHQVWMALFTYGWLFLVRDPRDQIGQLSLYFLCVFLPTMSAWYVYGVCPITELTISLADDSAPKLFDVASFCFVLGITTISLRKIFEVVRAWERKSIADYLSVAGLPLTCVLAWISFLVYKFGFSATYIAVSSCIACIVLIVTLCTKIEKMPIIQK